MTPRHFPHALHHMQTEGELREKYWRDKLGQKPIPVEDAYDKVEDHKLSRGLVIVVCLWVALIGYSGYRVVQAGLEVVTPNTASTHIHARF